MPQYQPRSAPEIASVADLQKWLAEEFRAIALAQAEYLELELRQSARAPSRPRDGMIVSADGGNWNPGAGEGAYHYHDTAWHRLVESDDGGFTFDSSGDLLGVVAKGPTQGIGYAAGSGGAVTQLTSRTTSVTLDKVSGAITLFSAAGSATPTTFTVNNSTVAATDVPHVVQKSGTDKYEIHVTRVAAGAFDVTFFTTGGTTIEQPVFNFALLRGVAS